VTITNENDLVRIREMLANPELSPIVRDIIEPMLDALLKAWADNEKAKNARVPTEIVCPLCNTKHVDQGEWAHEIAHRKHLCAQCGHVWAPYDVGTVGVAFGSPKLPVEEYIQMMNRDIAYVQGEWSAAGEEIQKLEKRRDELLEMVAKLSQTVPLDSEVSEALNQRGALLAEIGTLRSSLSEHEPLFKDALATQQFLEDVLVGIGPFMPRDTQRTVAGIIGGVKKMHETVKELQRTLHSVCEHATTHQPEDREMILEGYKLAQKDYFA